MLKQKDIQAHMVSAFEKVKETNPMAGSITNNVTMNLVANAQLAVGGSAAMVYLKDEGEILAKASEATYINVGTLLPVYEKALPHIAKVLHEENKKWVLDPVAIGIGDLRTQLLTEFKKYKPSVVRGNASEIIALASLWQLAGESGVSNVRGVDSTDSVTSAKEAAIAIAQWTSGAVAVSGQSDYVTDGKVQIQSTGGSHYMEKITGAGCSLGGVVAIYATVSSPLIAALTATVAYNIAGKRAGEQSKGPGSFEVNFLDHLFQLRQEDFVEHLLKIEEV